jgi:hypothetical protein
MYRNGRSSFAVGLEDTLESPDFDNQIKSPALRAFYRRWRETLINGGGLPNIDTFDPGDLAAVSFTAAVEPGGFRFVRFGERLAGWLGESLHGRVMRDDTLERFGSLEAAYRNCVEEQVPAYEVVQFDFGGGDTVSFERLVVPLFDATQSVAYVGGAVMIEDMDVVGTDVEF